MYHPPPTPPIEEGEVSVGPPIKGGEVGEGVVDIKHTEKMAGSATSFAVPQALRDRH